MLLNRKRELAYLDNRYARPGAEFVVLYGRRRVGKTTLMYEWCQHKSALYFFAGPAQNRSSPLSRAALLAWIDSTFLIR